MSEFHINLETAKAVLRGIFNSVHISITAFSELHHTVQWFRPADDSNSFSLQVRIGLEGCVTSFGTAKLLLKKTYKKFGSKGVDENKWKQFCDFWRDVSSKLEDEKNLVVTAVMELMRQEITHVWQYQGFFNLSEMCHPDKLLECSVQHPKMILVWTFNFYLGCFLAISFLFLELKPHLLSPRLFFRNADGLYYYISQHCEKTIEMGATVDNLYIYKLVISFVELGEEIGSMFPITKLECHDENKAILDAEARAGKILEPTERFNVYLMCKVKVMRESFQRNSLIIASQLKNNARVQFFRASYELQLFGQLMRDVIKKMKSLHIEMRRIVYYNLLQIISKEELQYEIQRFLSHTTESYLSDCIDLLKRCKQLIGNMTARNANIEFLTRLAFEEVYNPYSSLISVLPGLCKNAVVDYVCSRYSGFRGFLLRLMAKYIVMHASQCGRIGCNPMKYHGSTFAFLRFLQIYKDLIDELDAAIAECRDGTLVILRDWRKIITLPHRAIRHCWQMVLPNIHGDPPIDQKVIVRQLPLDKDLRQHIADLHLGPIFDGSEPKMEEHVKSSPHTRILRKSTVNMESYVPPSFDIFTQQELWTFFN